MYERDPGEVKVKQRICFIDDDGDFEIPLFENAFGSEFQIISGTSFEECQTKILAEHGWRPDLFVLDLYMPVDGRQNETQIDRMRQVTVGYLHDNAEMRRAYHNLVLADDRRKAILEALGQSAVGGISQAIKVRRTYHSVPMLFYSRKATAEDVLQCLAVTGVYDVIRKPAGITDGEIESRTHQLRGYIAGRFHGVIGQAHASESEELQKAVRRLKEVGFFRMPMYLFYSYATEDERYRVELEKRLNAERFHVSVAGWHFRQLIPGTSWDDTISAYLEAARIILLLVSPRFCNSNYIQQREMKRALEKHAAGEACVVPILVEPIDLEQTPLGYLQWLPNNKRAISEWRNQGAAWNDVMQGIEKAIRAMASAV